MVIYIFTVEFFILFSFKLKRTKASVPVFPSCYPKRKVSKISLWEFIGNLGLITYYFVQNIVLKFWPGMGCELFCTPVSRQDY